MLTQKVRGDNFSSVMFSNTTSSCFGGAPCSLSLVRQASKWIRSDNTDRVVSSSSAIMKFVKIQKTHNRLVCDEENPQIIHLFVASSRPAAWKENPIQHPWNPLESCALPLFTLICRAINWVMTSYGLSMILQAPI